MGLLDELRKQADAVRAQQADQGALQRQNIRVVEQKMRQAFQYLNELFKQLAVLKPEHAESFFIAGIGQAGGMRFADSFIDYRTRHVGDMDYIDHIDFYVRWQRPEKLVFQSDMLGAVAKMRDTLAALHFSFTEENARDGHGHPVMRIAADLARVVNVTIRAQPADGFLLFEANNLTGPGVARFRVQAAAVDEPLLEAFARLLLGQPTEFIRYRLAAGARP